MPENKFDVLNGAMETAEEAENLKSLLENPSNEELSQKEEKQLILHCLLQMMN